MRYGGNRIEQMESSKVNTKLATKLKPWVGFQWRVGVSGACLGCDAFSSVPGLAMLKRRKECDPKRLMFSWTSGNEEIVTIIERRKKMDFGHMSQMDPMSKFSRKWGTYIW